MNKKDIACIAGIVLGTILSWFGLGYFIISFFYPELRFLDGLFLMFLGIITETVFKTQLTFQKLQEGLSDILQKSIQDLKKIQNEKSNGISSILGTFANGSQIMKLDENTTEEEFEKFKEQFPFMTDTIDKIKEGFNTEGGLKSVFETPTPNSMGALEKALKNAIENEEFEKAEKLKKEIQKRKNSK